MRNWIKNIFGEKVKKEITQWKTNSSILIFLKNNIDENGSLKESAETLPDETKKEDEIKWAPGLVDSMFGADDSAESKGRIQKLFNLIKLISKNGNDQSKSDFFREITENDNVIGIIDEFLQKLANSSLQVEPYLFEYAHNLATKTNKRNSVKFGIAILGLCQNKKPIEDIKIIGLHNEFTVFSTIALVSLSDNLISDLWQLAKKVEGWGKIQLVDRLAEMDLTDEIRDWLVLEGYKNNIMYEYLALSCSVNGKLNNKLQKDSIQYGLFKSAGELIVALMDEGPAVGMSAYDDAFDTIQNYVRHSNQQDLKISDFITLHTIKDYLEESPNENETLKSWNGNDLTNCIIDINNILTSKDWTAEVKLALESSDSVNFWNGKQASKKLKIDITETLWNRLDKFPFDSTSWYDITNYNKSVNAKTLVDKAINLIPLKEISTGPKDSMGIGPDYQKHQSLDYVITFLSNYPTLGEPILLAGLKSPVTRNRNMTLKTLEKWKQKNWSEKLLKELYNLKEIEPIIDTKKNIERLIKGKELK